MRQAVLWMSATTMAAFPLLAGCDATPQEVQADVSKAATSRGGDCGRVSLGQGVWSVPSPYLTCFTAAVEAGGPGSLTVVSFTVEGDEIVRTYTVASPGVVNVRDDNTADQYAGSGAGITDQTCAFRVIDGEMRTYDCTKPVPVRGLAP